MMTRQLKVSVCLPTFNHARYIRYALISVLQQTLQDFEIIICDDASTDDTHAVVTDIRDSRIRYFRQQKNVGIAANRNACLAVAQGEYIAWLDSDDVYLPEMLARQSAVLDKHLGVGLVHGAFEVIDEDGRQLPTWPMPFSQDVVEPGEFAFRELVLANYVTAPTVLVRRNCHARVGLYASELRDSSEDWEMWMRIALHSDLAYTSTPVAQYRYHDASSSAASTKNGKRLHSDVIAVKRVFDQQRGRIPDVGKLERQAKAALAFKALTRAGDLMTLGKRMEAFSSTFQGVRIAPWLITDSHWWLLQLSTVFGDEYSNYRHSKALLCKLYSDLAGSRFGKRIEKLVTVNPEWEQTLYEIARTVRQHVPVDARIVVVDKYDPTVLHLSRRKGWHFPDRHIMDGGYPRDSEAAIEHLELLRQLGASYLVFPSAAYWWLEHYRDLRQHLDGRYQRIWHDDACMIYSLSPRAVMENDQELTREARLRS
jgi:glycosyltransferase involved in cell wall biosynthesis